jgi:hypothetical protein
VSEEAAIAVAGVGDRIGTKNHALAHWRAAEERLAREPSHQAIRGELSAFWDWALVELFVQSGVRIEEALELSALDVLRRRLPDGRVYYLLQIKPSRHDGLGSCRSATDSATSWRRSSPTSAPSTAPTRCRRSRPWDFHENRPRSRAPYLIQGAGQPRGMATTTVRGRLKRISLAAGARRADGEPLYLKPHGGRRMFASEHLNINTPVPRHRRPARPRRPRHGDGLREALPDDAGRGVPQGSAWQLPCRARARVAAQPQRRGVGRACDQLRDARHGHAPLRAADGDHCPRGLVCVGCNHAQPKQSAALVFARMAASHKRELAKARKRGESAGEIAARELEVERITSALRRARELTGDVAEAIEPTLIE